MLTIPTLKVLRAAAIVAVGAAIYSAFTFQGTASATPVTESWCWEFDDLWQVRWDSSFDDNQTTYSMFPSDSRQTLRDSYLQWDDFNVSNSDLTMDEISTDTLHETHPIDFSSMSWDDIPGHSSWASSGSCATGAGEEVTFGVSYLNTDWDFTPEYVDASAKEGDVKTVQVHEIGHPTGFGRPCLPDPEEDDCDSSTVMAPINEGTKRSLTGDDKSAVANKY